jgi:hypothetical protein
MRGRLRISRIATGHLVPSEAVIFFEAHRWKAEYRPYGGLRGPTSIRGNANLDAMEKTPYQKAKPLMAENELRDFSDQIHLLFSLLIVAKGGPQSQLDRWAVQAGTNTT